MITVHHLEHSQSFRILWLLEELGLTHNEEYEIKLYKRGGAGAGAGADNISAPPEYKEISPLGTSPVITDDDCWAAEDTLCESHAIMDYLLDKYSNRGGTGTGSTSTGGGTSTFTNTLRPAASAGLGQARGGLARERKQYLFFYHVAQGSFMPLLMLEPIFRAIVEKVKPQCLFRKIFEKTFRVVTRSFVVPKLQNILDQMEAQLAEYPFLAGNRFTAADISMIYPMEEAYDRFGRDFIDAEYPKCKTWLATMHERPAFQRAQALAEETYVAHRV